MTAPQRSLRELLGVWETWSRHAALVEAVDKAAARGDQDTAATLRGSAPDDAPGPLEAVAAAAELARLLGAGWVRAVDAAVDAGATWKDIAAASGRSAGQARADHASGAGPRLSRDQQAVQPPGAWLTTQQAAARVHRHVSTVTRAAAEGLLHGHQPVDRQGRVVPKSRWTFRPEAVDAWSQGVDERAQRLACGCAAPASASRRTGGAR